MTKSKKSIVTQWGTTAITFDSYSSTEKRQLLEAVKNLLAEIKEELGIEIFISYGVLLGGQRSGELIPYDFDLDVVFHSRNKSEVFEACRKLSGWLVARGAEIRPKNNGQFTAVFAMSAKALKMEFFAGWDDAGEYYHHFAVAGTVDTQDVLPLSVMSIEGVDLPVPRSPAKVLEAIYGSDWRIPNPDFRYSLTANDWKPFGFLSVANKKLKSFWEDYYSKPASQNVYSDQPSNFALLMADQSSRNSRILEFGCGNGRDTLYFCKQGFSVFAVDYAQSAIRSVGEAAASQRLSCRLGLLNVTNIPESVSFASQNRESLEIVYARFFVHGIDDLALRNFAQIAEMVLTQHGKVWLEFRIRPDGVDESDYLKSESFSNGNHFRRLRTVDETKSFFPSSTFAIHHSSSGRGLAVAGIEDPLICRLIFVRR